MTALTLVAFSANAVAAPEATSQTRRQEESQIPQTPSAPPRVGQTAPVETFRCERTFVYKGRALECDSHVRRDGEGLRPIIQDVPSAVSELDQYQRNVRKTRNSAYVSSLGLLLMLAGYAANRPPFENGAITTGGYFVMAGAAAGIGGLAYGLGATEATGRFSDHLAQIVTVGAIGLGLALAGVAIDHPPFKPGAKPGGYLVLSGLGVAVAGFSFSLGLAHGNETRLHNAVQAYNQANPQAPITLQFNTGISF